jgi:hypothetical protein
VSHDDFNHLLSSIKRLSAEQLRRLRQQLDQQFAPTKKPAATASGKADKRAAPKTACSMGSCRAAWRRSPIASSFSQSVVLSRRASTKPYARNRSTSKEPKKS